MSLTAGTRLGPYEIVSLIGAGGMGEVYRARDARLGRDVAVKVLSGSMAQEPDRLRRFEREAQAAGRLNHPNILTVHDVGTHEGIPFLVSELLEGQTLRQRVDRAVPSVPEATDLARQLAQGLAAAHEHGIVHRDLKPENLFITTDGRLKILDFGIARLVHDEPVQAGQTMTAMTAVGTLLGTSGYMSPEQVQGLPADHRSDIFAAGAILYEPRRSRRSTPS
jgi:serine/threonine protein kinase